MMFSKLINTIKMTLPNNKDSVVLDKFDMSMSWDKIYICKLTLDSNRKLHTLGYVDITYKCKDCNALIYALRNNYLDEIEPEYRSLVVLRYIIGLKAYSLIIDDYLSDDESEWIYRQSLPSDLLEYCLTFKVDLVRKFNDYKIKNSVGSSDLITFLMSPTATFTRADMFMINRHNCVTVDDFMTIADAKLNESMKDK